MSEFCTIKTKEIVNGRQLMYFNESLESWDSDLDLLENGYGFAAYCYNLISFNAITPKLKNAESMFTEVGNPTWSDGSTVRSIKIDYDTIENTQRMFEKCGTIELVSRKPLGSFLRFPSVTDGSYMFRDCKKVKVRQEGGDSVDGEGYLSFSSMVSACEMFESYKGGGVFGNGLFPVCRYFYGCFANAVYDRCELPLLSGAGIAPTGDLDCEKMFYYAQCSNHTYVELSSNIANTDAIRIIADSMFCGAKGKIKCRDSFMRQLSSATYMFYGADLTDGGLGDWNLGCMYCYIADGMFMNAKLDNITDKTFPELSSCYNFCANSTVKTVSNLYVKTASDSMFDNCKELTQAWLKIGYGDSNFNKMFNYATSLADVDIKFILDEVKCADYSYMFNDCGQLRNVHFSGMTSNNPINLKNAEYAESMFRNCWNLPSSDIISTVRSMAYLRNASYMFEGTFIEDYPFFENGNNGLLPYLENAANMFYGCTGMDVDFGLIHDKFPVLAKGNFMFTSVIDGTGRWYSSLPNLYESVAMFANTAIQHLGGGNLGEVLDFNSLQLSYRMFANCVNLTDCYMSLSSLIDGHDMFYNCTALQTVKLNNLTELFYGQGMFVHSTLSYATLHSSSSSYKLRNGDYMFAVKGPLEVELTSDDTYSIELFGQCSSAYMMFANGEYRGSELSLGQFDNFKIKGNLFTQGTPPLTNVGGMFNGRKIIDRETAQFIAGVAHYCNISSSSQTLGEIYIEDENNLDWFDVWGDWTRHGGLEIFSEYAYQTLSRNCRAGGNVSMKVFYPKPDPYAALSIVEGSQYIPDASTWNNAFASSGLVVTSVHDGWAWDDRHQGGSMN